MGRIVQISSGQGGQAFNQSALHQTAQSQSTQVSPADVGNLLKVAEMAYESELPGLVIGGGKKILGGLKSGVQGAYDWATRRNPTYMNAADLASAEKLKGLVGLSPDEKARQAAAASKATGTPQESYIGRDVSNEKMSDYDLSQANYPVGTAEPPMPKAPVAPVAPAPLPPEEPLAPLHAEAYDDPAALEAELARRDLLPAERAKLQAAYDAAVERAKLQAAADAADYQRQLQARQAEIAKNKSAFQAAVDARANMLRQREYGNLATGGVAGEENNKATMPQGNRRMYGGAYEQAQLGQDIENNAQAIVPENPGPKTIHAWSDQQLKLALDRLRTLATQGSRANQETYLKTQQAIEDELWARANPDKIDELASLEAQQNDTMNRAMESRNSAKASKKMGPIGSRKMGMKEYSQNNQEAASVFDNEGDPIMLTVRDPADPTKTIQVPAQDMQNPMDLQGSKKQLQQLRDLDRQTGGKVLERLTAGMPPAQRDLFMQNEARIAALKGTTNEPKQTVPPGKPEYAGGTVPTPQLDTQTGALVSKTPDGKLLFHDESGQPPKPVTATVLPSASQTPPTAKALAQAAYQKKLEAGDWQGAMDIKNTVQYMQAMDSIPEFHIPPEPTMDQLMGLAMIADTQEKRLAILQAVPEMQRQSYSLKSLATGEDHTAAIAHLKALFPEDQAHRLKLWNEIQHLGAQANKENVEAYYHPAEVQSHRMTAQAAADKAAIDMNKRAEEIAIGAEGKGSLTSREIAAREKAAGHPLVQMGGITVREGGAINRGVIEDKQKRAEEDQSKADENILKAQRSMPPVTPEEGMKPLLTEEQIKAQVAAAGAGKYGDDKAKAESAARAQAEQTNKNRREYQTQADIVKEQTDKKKQAEIRKQIADRARDILAQDALDHPKRKMSQRDAAKQAYDEWLEAQNVGPTR